MGTVSGASLSTVTKTTSFETKVMSIETLAGIKKTWLTVAAGIVKAVKVDMGTPAWDRSAIPMVGGGTCVDEDLQVDGQVYKVTCLSVGNPHCVVFRT